MLVSRGLVATTRGSSLALFLRDAVRSGWTALAAMPPEEESRAQEPQPVPLSRLSSSSLTSKSSAGTVIVLGSERKGVRPAAAKICGESGGSVFIETAPDAAGVDGPMVDSFNVSVAGAIILHHLLACS